MSTTITAEQVPVANRCIKAFYQGLKWADQFSIHGGYVGNRTFNRIFLIEDAHVLGVFDNRNHLPKQAVDSHPIDTKDLVERHRCGKGNIKTMIVLEKSNCRLANSEAVGGQSKFLIDVVYPAIEGIRAKLSGDSHGSRWQQILTNAQQQQPSSSHSATSGSLLNTSLLSDIYHNPKQADQRLAENSPLKLFYMWNSPLNVEFDSHNEFSQNLLPLGVSQHTN